MRLFRKGRRARGSSTSQTNNTPDGSGASGARERGGLDTPDLMPSGDPGIRSKQIPSAHLRNGLGIRFFHWALFLWVVGLVLSGLNMSFPLPDTPIFTMRSTRALHRILSLSFVPLFGARAYFDLVTKNYKNLFFNLQDLKDMPKVLAYLFLLRERPNVRAKYDSVQKLLFTVWYLIFIYYAVGSLGLIDPFLGTDYSRLLGGPQTIRTIKYFLAIFMAVTIPGHIYLALTTNPAHLQAMFTGYIREVPREIAEHRLKEIP